MDVDCILETFNRRCVDYLLIGGMNVLLRHGGSLTQDVDLWIDDPAAMTREEFSLLLRREEAKRNRLWDPMERWRMNEELIVWTDAQQPIPRNSRQGCLAAQRKWMKKPELLDPD
jgi:hypothetical protein